jgi:hypothetical protein
LDICDLLNEKPDFSGDSFGCWWSSGLQLDRLPLHLALMWAFLEGIRGSDSIAVFTNETILISQGLSKLCVFYLHPCFSIPSA